MLGSRAQTVVGCFLETSEATVVPHEPPPSTVTRIGSPPGNVVRFAASHLDRRTLVQQVRQRRDVRPRIGHALPFLACGGPAVQALASTVSAAKAIANGARSRVDGTNDP